MFLGMQKFPDLTILRQIVPTYLSKKIYNEKNIKLIQKFVILFYFKSGHPPHFTFYSMLLSQSL